MRRLTRLLNGPNPLESKCMSTLLYDVRYAIRQLLRNPGFALATVLSLALGIGVNTAIFSMVDGVLLRPLPYTNGDKLVRIEYKAAVGPNDVRVSIQEYFDFQKQNRTLASLMEYHSMAFTLLGRGEPRRVQTAVVSPAFFNDLGVKPLLGRTFTTEDNAPGANPVLLLTYEFWREQFGGDPNILGQVFEMNERPITVVGVLPRLPKYPGERDDLYIPAMACPYRSSETNINNRSSRFLHLFGRLKDNVTVEQAQTDLMTVFSRLRQEYPEVYRASSDLVLAVTPVREALTVEIRPTLLILLVAVGLVLLIACTNVANLILARLLKREREVALRAALGADRRRLIRQVLTESTLVAFLGGVLGLVFAYLGLDLLIAFASHSTARTQQIDIDGRVMLFTLGISLLTGIAFGLLPALHASRDRLMGSLKESVGQATASAGRQRFRQLLIVSQLTISFMLLVGAGLMIRSSLRLQSVDGGFDASNVLTMTLALPFSKYDAEGAIRFHRRLAEEVESLPGVLSTAAASTFPLGDEPLSPPLRVEGMPPGSMEVRSHLVTVSDDYFRTVGIPLLKGRGFNPTDHPESPLVAIISQSLANSFWPGQDPIGKRLSLGAPFDGAPPLVIVGIVGEVRQTGLDTSPVETCYLSFNQQGNLSMSYLVRANSDPSKLFPQIREVIRQIDPEQAVADVQTLAQVRNEWLAPARLTATLLGIFAVLAFLITVIGVSGVVSFAVNQRKQEIGIRMALGADRRRVLQQMLWQGIVLALIGLGLGNLGALALTRLMAGVLFGVQPTDPVTFSVVSLALLLVVAVACFVPARRAALLDPLLAIRNR